MKTYLSCCVATTALLVASGFAEASAQEAGNLNEEARSNQIVVTAQRREQNLEDVPVSVAVISGEQLAQQQVSTVADLAQLSPSITYSQSNNSLNSSINIRGIGTSVFSAAVEPSVSVVVDDVVLARQGQALSDLIDVQRVEVLRGPQSTLFGRNASAGVISITTQDATDYLSGAFQLQAAELDEYLASATISGPLGAGLRGRLTGFYKDVGGHINNIFTGGELNGRESFGVRGKLQLDATDRLSLTLAADYGEDNSACCQFQYRRVDDPFLANALLPLVPSETNDQVNTDAPVTSLSLQWGASIKADYDFDFATLTSITAYREWDFRSTLDVDGTPSQGDSTTYTGGLIALDTNDNDNNLSNFSQEVRLASSGDGPISYVVGAYYSDLQYDTHFERRFCLINLGGDSCPPPPLFLPGVPFPLPTARSGSSDGEVSNTNAALFGQLDWTLFDRLTLTAGVRTLRDETEFVSALPYAALVPGDQIQAVPAPAGTVDGPNNPNRFGEGSTTNWYTTSHAAARYALTDNANVYASYSRGFKAGTVQIVPELGSVEIDPETSDAYEIGFKGSFAQGRLNLNLALFDVTYEDYQAQTFNSALIQFILTNAGEVSSSGVEFELTAFPTDDLLLTLSAAYTDASIDSFPGAQCFAPVTADPDCTLVFNPANPAQVIGGFKDLSGSELPNSPDWKINAGMRYNLELPSLPFNAFFSANYAWQSETQFLLNQNPNTIQDAYGILDGSFGFTDNSERYTLTFFGKNLLDEQFAGFLFEDPLRSGGSVNIDQFITKNAHRYVGVQFRAEF